MMDDLSTRLQALMDMHWPNGRPLIMTLAEAHAAGHDAVSLVSFRGNTPIGFTRITSLTPTAGDAFVIETGADFETTAQLDITTVPGDSLVIVR